MACGCRSTTIHYQTPRSQQIENLGKLPNEITVKCNVINENNTYVSEALNTKFKKTLINNLKKSGIKNIYNSEYTTKVNNLLEVDISINHNLNLINTLITICTIGIVPNYISRDYLINFSYKNNGSIKNYSYRELTTTWIGFLVTGTFPDDLREQEVFDNISKNLLEEMNK